MSERRYYEDAYTASFQAKIIETVIENNRFGLVLAETYFYPASGGQPADGGTINGRPLTEITIRQTDEAIIHWLAEPAGEVGGMATAVIDWPRRFDHMQHHTGQHILSQAFIRIANAETVSFHLSENSVTIDLDRPEISAADIAAAEQLANQVVWESRPVTVQFVSESETQTLPLRKIPPGRNGRLRLINIAQFDLNACGGTHVSHTGSVGLIKIIKQERRGEKTRIEFCCGHRALQDYAEKHTIISDLTAALTTGLTEILPTVNRLQQENKEAQRTIRKQKETIMAGQAQRLISRSEQFGNITLITKCFNESDAPDLRALLLQLASLETFVALLGQSGKRTQLLFARSPEAPGDMNHLLQVALAQLGDGRGGGSDSIAQGGGPPHTDEEVEDALKMARTSWSDWLQ